MYTRFGMVNHGDDIAREARTRRHKNVAIGWMWIVIIVALLVVAYSHIG